MGQRDTREFHQPITVTYAVDPNKEEPQRHIRLEQGYWISQIVLAVIGAVGIVVALWTLSDLNRTAYDTHRQANDADTQAKTAQQEFELSERPWLFVGAVKLGGLTYDKDVLRFSAVFRIRNIGHSPAAKAILKVDLIPLRVKEVQTFSEPFRHQKQMCSQPESRSKSTFEGGDYTFTLLPGQWTEKNAFMVISPQDRKQAEWIPFGSNNKPIITLFMVGCVDYGFEFKAGRHQSGFIYGLTRVDPKYPLSPFVIYSGEPVPEGSITILPYGYGDSFYAN
jgi:hypothetical protein